MKALLINEWISIKKSVILYIVMFACAVCAGIFDTALSDMYFVAFMTSFSACFMTSDVRSRWNRYCITLPISRRDIIMSKSLYIIFREIPAYICYLLPHIIYVLNDYYEQPDIHMSMCLELVLLISIMTSAVMFIILCFGTVKGQKICIFVCMPLAIFAGFVISISDFYMPQLSHAAVMAAAAIILRLLAVKLSISAYNRREL